MDHKKLAKAIKTILDPDGTGQTKVSFQLRFHSKHPFIHLRHAGSWVSNPPVCASCGKPESHEFHSEANHGS